MDFLPGLEVVQNVHPLFVHFPIALVLVTLLFEGIWWVTKKEHFRAFATWLLYLSALSAAAGVITGLLASNGLGHDSPGHDYVHVHRDIMYWMTGLLLTTTAAVAFLKNVREGAARRFLIVALLAISGLLAYGADKGGRLVFEFGMGVRTSTEQPAQQIDSHSHEESGGHEATEAADTMQQKVSHDSSTHEH